MRILSSVAALTLALATVGATLSITAHAGTVSKSVSYADLNLSTPAGIEKLEGRVNGAIRAICGSMPHNLGENRLWKRCVAEARQSAAPQMLAAISSARGEAYAEANVTFARKR